ncbi:hypothetical protein AN640_06005 [Candidatus Epulonipiscium fishelsonii]|uniref:Uncharacterized protein n=1 Tax=Candidatus Epulonipiscium fishelsonii TaxID=77094 RepID=A0ACC8XIB7_9FIRM|nr:hypothetical protein AN640_06005 [Epulopiscium sp. SCG-D08WGA-EpuloA1]OON94851.1 MAG: hypothetical protein ATN32_01410 [Epulopiscium sp. AS2M-Bin002]
MDIAGLSMGMSQMNVGVQLSVSVAKMTMDTVEQSSQIMNEMMRDMETSVNPNLGSNINIKI